MVDGQLVGLVFVFADADVVGLDPFDEVFAFDGASRKLQAFSADLVQVLSKHCDNLADFGIDGIVSQYDGVVPDKLPVAHLHLLWSGKNMGVLRPATKGEDDADNDNENVFHGCKVFQYLLKREPQL